MWGEVFYSEGGQYFSLGSGETNLFGDACKLNETMFGYFIPI